MMGMRAVFVSLMLAACGDFVPPASDTSAAEAGAAGAPLVAAGATTTATGGATTASSGGATATQTVTSQATGGTVATGGTSSATGGAVATGGAKATGGTQTGGAATGGAVSTGGTVATGGASAGAGTGGYPMGIAGAPGYSCPTSLWDVGIIGAADRIERSRIGYDTTGMCFGTGETRCGNQACFKISTLRADSINIELSARSRYTAIARDGTKSCASIQSLTTGSPLLGLRLGVDVGANDRFWLIEEHCASTYCDIACDSPMAP